MARVKTFSSKKDLDAFLNAADSSATSVLNFWADWSEASRQMTDVFVELSNQPQLKDVNFVSVEAESSAEISIGYDIKAVPTFIFVKNGKQFDRVDGAHASELSKRLQTYATTSALPNFVLGKPADQPTLSKEELNERLKRLIQSAPCMVFMKGDADHPKCGFSKQLVSLLNTHEVDFKSFDILQDEAVRQGLKEFSNWPTYPQIYLNGEFLGGLDILRESLESGDLQGRLPIKQSLNDRLKSLINKADVMVFMKGQPDQPKCGFSKTLMQILKDANVKFAHFDILSDEDVRQGLKTYSNWPTYPQVYVKGELIGGLDIIKELKESGDLESTLKIIHVMSVITSLGTLRLENNKEDIIKAAVSIFGCLSSTPSDLISTMDSLTLFVQSFDSSFEQLVAKIMAYDWYTGNQEVIDRIVIFLNKLACTQVCFVEPILTGIVRKLIPRTIQDASNSSDYVSNRAFGAVVQLLNSVPNSTLKLPQIASRAFPFMKRPKEEISGFVKNLLDICANFPTLRSDLLLIIVEEMVKLDVRASREDVEERQQSSYELDVDPEEMFPMETNSAAVTHEETVATAADEKTLHEMGSRLDECLSLLFEFIVLTDSNTPSDGKGNALEKLYKDLLEAFQTKVLPVYACCHTQFLIFRICGMQQRLCRHFLSWLWSKFSDPSVPAILRQTSGCYMASLVARAKFISIEDSKSHLTTWLQWITSYMGTQEVRKQSWAIHGTFYSLCQAVFYVVAFRLKEFLAVPGGLNFLQSLGLERIVNCRLNPLKFCFSHVVDNFALITRNYQLAFCYSVIDRNKRQSCGEVDSTVGQNPLEGFFPFDPYVLRKSKRFIDEFYRDYRGLTEEDEEGEDMVMAESFSPRSLERPKDLVWYGTSPGFKHG